MRQIVLDTETTGLEAKEGHKIIEIAAIEINNRRKTERTFHHYINPKRDIDEAATEVHGIKSDFLQDKPVFSELASEFLDFITGAELIIHNAPFDVAFINHEFMDAGFGENLVQQHCSILDTLAMARKKHPGQKNNLDALCKRYGVDNAQRTLHGGLLDAEILVDVYLYMTGGQTSLLSETSDISQQFSQEQENQIDPSLLAQLKTVQASKQEIEHHEKWLALLREKSQAEVVWDRIESIH